MMGETDTPRRRFSDRLLSEYAAAEVLAERIKRLEISIAAETALRDAALAEYKATLADKMELLNHLREQVLSERATFAPRDWADEKFSGVEQRFRGVDRTVNRSLGAAAAFLALLELVLRFWPH